MIETREIDLAWGAVNFLGIWARQALDAIEQSGGRNPHLEGSMEAANLIELRKYGYASIAGIIAKATGDRGPRAVLPSPVKCFNLTMLIQVFKDDPKGRYQKTAHKTRHNYDMQFQLIDREVGDLPLDSVTINDVLSWYERWSASGQHLCMGHTVVGKVRMLLRYGAATMEDKDCIRLNGALSAMRITKGSSSVRGINAKQADAVRMTAHKKKAPSIALAQAFMFDLKMGQKQVIGEWVSLSEPGESVITKKKQKWLPGLEWSQIDEDLILRLSTGGEIKEFDLRRGCGMVMAELKRLREIPKEGPLVVRERKRLPYSAVQFRTEWRAIATAAGVPKSVQNVTYQTREPSRADNVKAQIGDNSNLRSAPLIDTSKVWEFISDLCKTLRADIREEVAAEMSKHVLEGKVSLDELSGSMSEYVRWYHRTYGDKFKFCAFEDHQSSDNLYPADTILSEDED